MQENIFLKDHYNKIAKKDNSRQKRNQYYHKEKSHYCNFLVSPGNSILELGCGTGCLLNSLSPVYGVGVDINDNMIAVAKKKYPNIDFYCEDVEKFYIDKVFDYIVIDGTLGSIGNIQKFLQHISKMANAETRIIINYYNELWGPLLRFAERVGLKTPEIIFNWLSIDDIKNFCEISGYQIIRTDFRFLFPLDIPIISFLINKFIAKLPIIRRLTLMHSVVARPYIPPINIDEQTVSVILTCRDEEENIEGLVKGIPDMGQHTEIIFVEGHSTDRTVDKINEMIKQYPRKDIKLYKQKGTGQGDAFRLGCEKAGGDFLCWIEADLTIPPQEIELFWDAYRSGKGEYINGTRFIYQMEKKAMPFFNFIGNRFFGNVFSVILKQRFTDTLCGFKCISRKNYEKIHKQIDFFGDFDPFGDFELIFGAIKNNLKVVEIPIHYCQRTYGQPKAYGKTIFSFLRHAWLLWRMTWVAFVKFVLL